VLYVALMYVLWLFDTVLTGVICGTDVRIVIIWYSSDRCDNTYTSATYNTGQNCIK
jgi:hypothetical protein